MLDGPRTWDEKPAATPPPASKKPLDPELEKLLADPLRATRSRYLPPGKYTIEIRAGGETKKTPLVIKSEREGGRFSDAPEGQPESRSLED